MKISYSDDTQKGPGHGIFTFSETLFPDGPYSMAVLRASDHAYLAGGAGGGTVWVGETRFMPVRAETTPEGGITVPVGPEVVDALDPLEKYLVTLKPEQGDELKARLQVADGITYSPDRRLDNTGMRAQDAAPPSPPASEPVAPAGAETSAAVTAAETPLTLSPEPPAPAPSAPRKPNPVLIVALLAALLAGGLATWKFFDSKAREEQAALSGKSETPAAPATELPPTQKSAEEQVRAFFSGPDVTAKAALNLAAQLPKATPPEQDALYRLYYFAAESEAPAAFMPYAACLDPAEPQWGTIEKDAAAAYAAYAKAAASDPKVAKAALEAQTRLRAWLERESAAGNARARAWLQELP
ncbi:hypothetical protein [Desulfovibrio sp.]|uniref:hypothetical protein n=1 Tax=Desulfovibrio sp. TaxID=885 RepID=UPI0023CBB442|nr:hypothetical protein [Desulfovibrio sp.]MDE7241896.1 hypothetical protein [Desulfovibrio sp.]